MKTPAYTTVTRFPAVLAVSLLMPLPVLAETPAPVLHCIQGEGCARGEARISEQDAGLLFGQEITPGEMSIVYLGEQKSPTLVQLSPEKVNELYGGGNVMPRMLFLPYDSGNSSDAIEVFAPGDEGKNMQIELFADEAVDDGIVPRDGLWRVTSRDQTFSECPSQMESMLRSSGQLDAQNETRRFEWGGKFDPETFEFMNPAGQQMEWQRTGPNSFTGELFDARGGSARVAADLATRILSPTEIESSVDLFIGAMAGGEALAAMGLANCRVNMTFDIRHSGD